jgi:hypothetical protein
MVRRIAVESIESFVGQNIGELSYFSRDKLKRGFRRLLETYNDRVNAAETDNRCWLRFRGICEGDRSWR